MTGVYKSASGYVRDLKRCGKTGSKREAFLRLKAELARAYAAPDDTYHALSAVEVIEKDRTPPGA